MIKPPIPSNEVERLNKLYSYRLLDTASEACFDEITRAAALVCGTKISLVSLIDLDRQWFKSKYGLDATETPRDISFCGHAICGDDVFIVEDATLDARFSDNPFITAEPGVRFYAGIPLKTPEGYNVGTLCVVDSSVRKLDAKQIEILRALASSVVQMFELRVDNEKLNRITQQYSDIQKMVKAGGWELDVKTGNTIWSDEIYEIYGIPKGTPTNKTNGLMYYAEHERPRLGSMIQDCIEHKRPFNDHFEFVDAKGVKKWVHSIGRPVVDETGSVSAVVGTFQDVTEQVKREKDLALVINNISEGYFDWHIQKDYEFMSPRFWEILGYDYRTRKHHPSEWQALLHPDDLSLALSMHQKHVVSRGQIPYRLEIRFKKADGEWLWMSVEGKVVEWDSGGAPLRMVGIGRDIHQAKIAEKVEKLKSAVRSKFIEEATEKKKFFTYLLEQIIQLAESEYGFVGEILEDANGKYLKSYALTDISWDEATRKFYRENAPLGLEFRNLNTLFGWVIRNEEKLITNDPAHHPSAGGIPKGHPPLKSFMGIPIWVNQKCSVMIGVANRQNGYSESFYDSLKPFFDFCGEIIQTVKFSEELENQKSFAYHQSKLASIGELAAGVGHEINNPLAILQGQLQTLKAHMEKAHPADAVANRKIEKGLKAGERIEKIVKGLRSFARADGKEFSVFKLEEMVSESVGMLSELYQKEGVEFELNLEKDLYIRGMIGRVQQVLINLLSNAKDAIERQPTKKISVKACKVGAWVILEVADSGTGVPDGILDKIFDPFFTTKEVNKGTGIGLALVSNIVKEHSGKVSLKKGPLSGACFQVQFPLVDRGLA